MSTSAPDSHPGLAGAIARAFINSKLTPLVIITSVLLGLVAILLLPREEEPQIKVPMVDVMVAMPGAEAKEVEERVTRPMEQLLWEIPGVEYLYSTSQAGRSLVIVRFKVGEDVEISLVKLNQKLQTNFDRIPPGVSQPLIKPRSIDDVPILALTFHGGGHDHLDLRRIAVETMDSIKQVPQVAETTLIGGAHRQLTVTVDLQRLAAHGFASDHLVGALAGSNSQLVTGRLVSGDQTVLVETGDFLKDEKDVANLVIGAHDGRPVYVRDVATVADATREPGQYVFHGTAAGDEPAVTLAIAKRPGANAIAVAHAVLAQVDLLKGRVIPGNVQVSVVRNYGETSAEKSDELLLHMGIAVLSVSLLILMLLGWRESIVVAIAIPATLALTLLVLYLYGYTLNRITLFALIFSIGILVDDAIVVVENIARHVGLARNRGRGLTAIAVEAVGEVGNPTILATIAVIAAILPMAMVGGLMGPYMRPIPVGASAAMIFSLLVAFIVTPWAAIRILKLHGHGAESGEAKPGFFARTYRGLMERLLKYSLLRWSLLGVLGGLLVAAMTLVPLGLVKVKMLPFDNKSEFQVVLNMPEGTALERTAQVARELAGALRVEPEVADYQVYIGTSAPFNFNGLVRHYFMRQGDQVADIQVNLLPRHERAAQSHDIAKRIRPRLMAIAQRHGARITVAEVPPGPPVLQTLVAEAYGPSTEHRLALATRLKEIFASTPGVVDVDWYVEAPQAKARFVVDKEKAALHGVSTAAITSTLRLAVDGMPVGLLHLPREKEDVPIVVELPEDAKATPQELLAMQVASPAGLVPLRELGHFTMTTIDRSIYHKNLLPVTYVIGDVAGAIESPVYAIAAMNERVQKLAAKDFGGSGGPGATVAVLNASMPDNSLEPAVKWDGEWHITIEVFRDLGSAFAGVLVLIYFLMVGWFRSFTTPLVVMVVIPFSLLGVLPAHAGWGAFFTATSMIGFMAGAGIVVRNSVILVDFIEARMAEGSPLHEAAIEAGIVRFRPMLLTALAVVAGAAIILADPIFQGLALSLMAGGIASLLVAPLAVPLLYVMVHRPAVKPGPTAD